MMKSHVQSKEDDEIVFQTSVLIDNTMFVLLSKIWQPYKVYVRPIAHGAAYVFGVTTAAMSNVAQTTTTTMADVDDDDDDAADDHDDNVIFQRLTHSQALHAYVICCIYS